MTQLKHTSLVGRRVNTPMGAGTVLLVEVKPETWRSYGGVYVYVDRPGKGIGKWRLDQCRVVGELKEVP